MWITTDESNLVNTDSLITIRKNWEGKGEPEKWFAEAVTQRNYPGRIKLHTKNEEAEIDLYIKLLMSKIK